MTRLCKDCKWCKPYKFLFFRDWSVSECISPLKNGGREPVIIIDPVTGGTQEDPTDQEPRYCSVQRQFGPCGPAGTRWEPR